MMRRKTAMSMDSRYAMMIENAFYNVNPPEIPLAEKVSQKTDVTRFTASITFKPISRW